LPRIVKGAAEKMDSIGIEYCRMVFEIPEHLALR
jgi:hypothetical protein